MPHSLVIRAGTVVDGTGAPPFPADVAIDDDRIAMIGTVPEDDSPELRADGCAIAPGFINVLSHAYQTLQLDPRGLSDLYQGVTTEVFGEGYSLGPSAGQLPAVVGEQQAPDGVRLVWPRLHDFLQHLESSGVGPNVASFVGAGNLRMIHAGADQRPLTDSELAAACDLLDSELADGALGLGSALIYSPGNYASTEELIAYAKILATHDALYISHIRDEASRLREAISELIEIARRTGARAEIYHLKASGRSNWPSMRTVIADLQAARADGVRVTADVYPYEAGATRLAACIPPRFHEGGTSRLLGRLADRSSRAEIRAAIAEPSTEDQNIYLDAGGSSGVLLLGPPGSDRCGNTLAEVSAQRGDADPISTLLDLVAEDPGLLAAYFGISEENIRLVLEQPWVSVCSDAEAPAAEYPFVDTPAHPRTYGSFARVLGRYVRDGTLSLEDAVRRMTSLPADNLHLRDRGRIQPGAFADLAIFRPDQVNDLATYERPHVYAEGMQHVLINGRLAFTHGAPTGTLSGRALRRDR